MRARLRSEALTALLVGLEAEGPAVLVVDMVEQGLDQATQEALIIHLRQRAGAGGRPLFLMTRSTSILDLSAIGPDEAFIFALPITARPLASPPIQEPRDMRQSRRVSPRRRFERG